MSIRPRENTDERATRDQHAIGIKVHKEKDIIIVYSGFRSSSTWFWSRLRKCENLRCYYEVLNECLTSISPESITHSRPSAWRSRHPDEVAYQLEYLPLIMESGVPGFPVEETLGCRLIGSEGIDGPLDEDVRDYLNSLVSFARTQGQIPVLACTRLLARSAGLRQSFPGLHILLVRNLFRQWNSYSGQHRHENPYFLETLFSTLQFAGRDPYISYLSAFFSQQSKNSLDAWIDEDNYDKIFCYFAALHIYFLIHARRNVDLIVDINALSDPDTGYRQEVEATIRAKVGASIDLSNAQDGIDFPKYPIRAPEECRRILRGMVEKAHIILGSTSEEESFASRLLDELWNEHRVFSFYADSANEALAIAQQDLTVEQAAGNTLRDVLDERSREVDRLKTEAAIAQQDLTVEQAAGNTLRDVLDERNREVDRLKAEAVAAHEETQGLRLEIEQATERFAGEATSLRAQLGTAQHHLEDERARHDAFTSERDNELAHEREEKRTLTEEIESLQRTLAEERHERHLLAVERTRLYQDLKLEGGPMALRGVLPLARLLRPALRWHGRIKRALHF